MVEIDTLWNVKIQHNTVARFRKNVEIDTLWNVKVVFCVDTYIPVRVEIDTLWNVKLSMSELVTLPDGR